MKKRNIMLSIATISLITSTLSASWIINGKAIMNEHPLQSSIRSIENGGTLSAIDAYQDGVGVFIDGSGVTNSDQIDNSAFNKLVFKAGPLAKINETTISEQILFGVDNDFIPTADDIINANVINNSEVISPEEPSIANKCLSGEGVTIEELRSLIANDLDVSVNCTSNITDMSLLFKNKSNFNQDISTWDVSNVTNMNEMFFGTTTFNQDLNSWDVSNVTSMISTFRNSINFNGNISNWNVESVIDMSYMFNNAQNFNQNVGNWNNNKIFMSRYSSQ